MSSRGGQPASVPRTSAKVGKPSFKNPVSSHFFPDSTFQDNLVLRREEQNSEIHTPFMNRSEQKKLLEENIRLKHELEDLRSQYEQLIEEGKNECFDERRVNLLKAHILQLERQVVLLTEGLSSQADLLVEFNASLEAFTDKLSSFLSTKESALEVLIPRPEFLQTIEICHTMRQKLHKNQQVEACARTGRKGRTSFFPICCGSTNQKWSLFVGSNSKGRAEVFIQAATQKQQPIRMRNAGDVCTCADMLVV